MHRQREIRQGGQGTRTRQTGKKNKVDTEQELGGGIAKTRRAQSKNKAGAEQEQGGHRARIRRTQKKVMPFSRRCADSGWSFPFVLRLVACVAGVAAQDILAYVRHVEVGVYLCRTNLLVSEHRLDSPEVCPTLKERCGE